MLTNGTLMDRRSLRRRQPPMSPLRAARCVSVTSNKATHAVGSRASTCSTRIVSTTGSSATVAGLSSSPPPLFLQTQTLNPNPEIGLGLASKHPKPLPLLRTRAQPVVANLASITCETVTPDSGCAHGYSPLTSVFRGGGGRQSGVQDRHYDGCVGDAQGARRGAVLGCCDARGAGLATAWVW
jgi:hypothetical protein